MFFCLSPHPEFLCNDQKTHIHLYEIRYTRHYLFLFLIKRSHNHKWEWPVRHYPRPMEICHYPIEVDFYGNFARFIIKITLIRSQIITLNIQFASFTRFNVFTRIYIQVHFPSTLPDCTRENGIFFPVWTRY